ncbi:hypothetical protein IFM89_001982 [Coptis chinensis]|uniref:At2g35280-like TPR domain-containing protein n=1 Tax=Coptis chinensis TaxID=261450 RepID=A0A835LPD7_9MAGN|nr:hypothetical protein IFM89_001982 [Coptis chinensis]
MDTIPNDMISTIVAHVAKSSVADLFSLKQTCKMLYELGDDDFVLQQASLEKIPAVPWRLSDDAAYFLQRCQQTGNPEALFRLGMVEYFQNARLELGLAFLARAAYFGHVEACYVLGIVLICTDDHTRQEGMELLTIVEKCKKGSRCRQRIKMILRDLWLNHTFHPREPLCTDPGCSKAVHMSRRGWARDDDEEFDCEACKCDREVKLFCKGLRGN